MAVAEYEKHQNKGGRAEIDDAVDGTTSESTTGSRSVALIEGSGLKPALAIEHIPEATAHPLASSRDTSLNFSERVPVILVITR
jgi:hypothetical protein